MSRPPLRKQLAFPLLASAVFGLALYLLHKISGDPLSSEFMTDPKGALQWAMRFASIALWLSVVSYAVVEAPVREVVRLRLPARRTVAGGLVLAAAVSVLVGRTDSPVPLGAVVLPWTAVAVGLAEGGGGDAGLGGTAYVWL